MKGLFKHKPRTPVELVRATRDLLLCIDSLTTPVRDVKKEEKLVELARNFREMKTILYGNSECEPVPETCAQLTQEIFKDDTLKLMIKSVPKIDLEARKDVRQVVANLQRQQVNSRLISSDYLEKNKDVLDTLVMGYENPEIALHYGTMLRECIRHQTVARYLLESGSWKHFFKFLDIPNFDVASDAGATFKELMTRHKSTVAEYLSKNYDSTTDPNLEGHKLMYDGEPMVDYLPLLYTLGIPLKTFLTSVQFCSDYNSKLLESKNYIVRRQGVKLLGDILLDRSNTATMIQYISSKQNLIRLMILMKEPSMAIRIEAFHVFKLFVANTNKPPEIVNILVANRDKLLRFLGDFTSEKEDEQFNQDKAQVMKEIARLEGQDMADPTLSKGKSEITVKGKSADEG